MAPLTISRGTRLAAVALGATAGDAADAADQPRPLGNGDGASGIEQVEEMRTLHATVVGGQGEATIEQGMASF